MRRWLDWLLDRTPANTHAAPGQGDDVPPEQPVAVAPPVTPFVATPEGYPHAYGLRPDGTEVFDPALRHCARAYRRGDPVFADPADGVRWYAARASILDHVLRTIAASPWRRRLALRGSMLMRAQVGEAARAPGDIDWLVLPAGLKIHDPSGRELIDEIARLIPARPVAGEAVIDAGRVALDAIWTYERAEGLRLTFLWAAPGLPPGSVQLDFVFGEPLSDLAVETAIPLSDGSEVGLFAASAELSLCWKLYWLGTDAFPQGKDLYDAVLLAERVALPVALLAQVSAPPPPGSIGCAYGGELPLPLRVHEWQVDWDNFRRECPWVEGDAGV
jgi:hypothetical protein